MGALALPALLGAFMFGSAETPGDASMRQGDAAISTGDRKSAERFYLRALEQGKEDITLWSTALFRLGTLALQRNDIPRAKALLQEFRQRIPAGSAGTLPGEIMAAEGDYAGAEKFFNTLISRNDVFADQARFGLADIRIKQQKYEEALKILVPLKESRSAHIARRSEYAQILTLIKMGKIAEAEKLLEIPLKESRDSNFMMLRLLCAAKSDDIGFFRKHYQQAVTGVEADEFVSTVSEFGAELAAKKSDPLYAAKLYEDAFCFALDSGRKRELAGKLFSCCAAFDAERAAQVAEKYARLFPHASDRALMQMQSGRLLASQGKYSQAVKFYMNVVHDSENLLVERRAAALEGASAAEQGGLVKEAEYFYDLLITNSPEISEREQASLQYAGFLMRRREYSRAAKILDRLFRSSSAAVREQAAYRLLQAKSSESVLSEKEIQYSSLLEKSRDRKIAEFGCFISAEIARISGRSNKEVREKYLEFIKKYPASKFVPQARFHAARLAGKGGKYIEAAKEFISFADKFPEHKNSGAARFMAIDYFCRASDTAAAAEQLKKLREQRKYPEAFSAGLLYIGEYMLNRNECKKALELISEMTSGKDFEHFSSRADMLYLQARLHARLKDYDNAVAALDKLIAGFPGSQESADANFLAGNLRFDVYNDYKRAEQHFKRAYELASGAVTSNACAGRLADCRYTMYLGNKDAELLASAEEIFRMLAEKAVLPAMRLQAQYKAGKCRETAGDSEKAFEDYEQVLYLALSLRESGLMPEQRWCELAAYNAIQLALSQKDFEANTRAQQILQVYRKLGFEHSNYDFDILKKNIRERQQLMNRGAR